MAEMKISRVTLISSALSSEARRQHSASSAASATAAGSLSLLFSTTALASTMGAGMEADAEEAAATASPSLLSSLTDDAMTAMAGGSIAAEAEAGVSSTPEMCEEDCSFASLLVLTWSTAAGGGTAVASSFSPMAGGAPLPLRPLFDEEEDEDEDTIEALLTPLML